MIRFSHLMNVAEDISIFGNILNILNILDILDILNVLKIRKKNFEVNFNDSSSEFLESSSKQLRLTTQNFFWNSFLQNDFCFAKLYFATFFAVFGC